MAKPVLSFSDVIGQEAIIKWCITMLQRDTFPQVSLFVGPSGVGKTTTAKIAACELATKDKPEMLTEVKEKVIINHGSTDCVRFYNMSNLNQETVNEVRAELTVGFSSTGRKVIIMDEAHGMSEESQDSLLTAFECLPPNVYVIICSTELDKLKQTLRSRCLLRRFTILSTPQMTKLISNKVKDRGLSFEMSIHLLTNYLMSYAEHEPRRALNVLEMMPENTKISNKDIEMYLSVFEPKQALQLISYMYLGNVVSGLNLIQDMTTGVTMQDMFIDILKIALGDNPACFSKQDADYIKQLVADDTQRLTAFVIECGKQRLTKQRLAALFLQFNTMFTQVNQNVGMPEMLTQEQVLMRDLPNMDIEVKDVNPISSDSEDLSFESFLDNCRIAED